MHGPGTLAVVAVEGTPVESDNEAGSPAAEGTPVVVGSLVVDPHDSEVSTLAVGDILGPEVDFPGLKY